MKSKLLEVSGLQAHYNQFKALNDIEFNVDEGEIVCLLGRNGMGKSTTVKCICGIIRPSKGSILFKGAAIRALSSFEIANMGIGLVPEGRRIFSNLTLYENLLSAQKKGYWDLSKILDLFPVFKERLNQMSLTLSGGEQQMLSIGRALMTNPSLLILDEATEGLSPIVSEQVWRVLKSISKEGVSILIIDKLSSRLSSLSHSAFLIESGTTVWKGKMEQLTKSIASKHLGV